MLALVLAAGPSVARGQTSDARVARVRRLVTAGERSAAQLLADSMLVAYPEGTNEYADALYARALSSASAADAERDYLRIGIEYPLSPRSEDALMMVAQLRLARGDRAGARRSFERLTRDYPSGEQIAKASFWAGRLALDDGDGARACPSLLRAQQLVSADDVELKNQIDYYVLRCSSAAMAARDTTPPPKTNEPKVSALPSRQSAAARAAATRDSTARVVAARRDSIARADSAKRAARDMAQRENSARAAATRDSIARERARRDSIARDSMVADSLARAAAPNDEPGRKGPPPRADLPPAATRRSPPAAAQNAWSVQVAAFPKERDAKALSEVLTQRGYQVRVVGEKAPFRVRVGRYATREEAAAALGRMKAKRLNGVVVEAEPQ